MHHCPCHLLAGYCLAGLATFDEACSSTRPRGEALHRTWDNPPLVSSDPTAGRARGAPNRAARPGPPAAGGSPDILSGPGATRSAATAPAANHPWPAMNMGGLVYPQLRAGQPFCRHHAPHFPGRAPHQPLQALGLRLGGVLAWPSSAILLELAWLHKYSQRPVQRMRGSAAERACRQRAAVRGC
jgi:hypothetical protein